MQSSARRSKLGIGSWILIGLCVLFAAWVTNMGNKMSDAIIRFGPVITALEQYRNDRGEYPDSLSNLTPTYLSEIPNCPLRRSYLRDPAGTYYHFHCITSVIIFFPQGVSYNSDRKTWYSGEL